MTTPLPADAETLFARLRDSLKDALGASCNGLAQGGADAPKGEGAAGATPTRTVAVAVLPRRSRTV